jgi:hypothetical protein
MGPKQVFSWGVYFDKNFSSSTIKNRILIGVGKIEKMVS